MGMSGMELAGRVHGRGDGLARACLAMALLGLAGLSGCVAGSGEGSPFLAAIAPDPADAKAVADAAAGTDDTATGSVSLDKADRVARNAEPGTISGSAAIDKMIVRHAEENGVPPALAFAVVRVESRYNPHARGGGAYGLSQIKPATARSLGFSGPANALYDADTNLTYGMKYLKGAWEKGDHDVCRTALKYKGGHRATRMTTATLRYCSAVKAQMASLATKRSAPGRAVEGEVQEASVLQTVASTAASTVRSAFAEERPAKDRTAPVSAVPASIRIVAAVKAADPVREPAQADDAGGKDRGGRIAKAEPDQSALAARLDGAFAD